MPKPENQLSTLRALNRARGFTAGLVLALGALLHYVGAFPFAFVPFALTVLATGLACLLLPLIGPRVGARPGFAAFQISLDVVLVTAIVAVSGGPNSLFVPLYVLWVMAACFVLSRPAGLVVAGLSSLLYLGLVLGPSVLPLLSFEPAVGPDTTVTEILTVVVNALVLVVVAMVTTWLAERYRRSQQHLEAQRKHLSDVQAFRDLIFESVGSGLVAVDTHGRITAYNRAAESITGVPAAGALGQPWGVVFGPGVDLDEARAAAAGESGPAPRYEFRLRRRDGRQIPVGISFWSLRSGGGDVSGLIGVCQDLSSIKQMEDRVRRADRLATVGRLSANMAHEIRNPLASISGAVEALAKELPPDPTRDRLVEIVMKESARLNNIVGDFLEYARPAPLAPTDVNLAEMLDEVSLLIEHRVLPANLKVMREYAELLPARVDPQQMRQAIWNLCINAVQSMPDGGELRIGGCLSTETTPSRLRVWISDTGHGIADGDLPHIFEPFYSTKPEGSGLGLAHVYRVVQDHGGHIEVQTRASEGSTFTLTLPSGTRPQP